MGRHTAVPGIGVATANAITAIERTRSTIEGCRDYRAIPSVSQLGGADRHDDTAHSA